MKNLVIIMIMALSVLPAVAQEQVSQDVGEKPVRRSRFFDRLYLAADISYGHSNKGIKPVLSTSYVGYEIIPYLTTSVAYGGGILLYDKNDERSFFNTSYLGGRLEFLVPEKDYEGCKISFHGMMAASVGNAEWHHTLYDIGFSTISETFNYKVRLSLSYRHINSHTVGIDNYNGAVVSIGLTIK